MDTMALFDDEGQGVVQIGGTRLPLMGTGRIYICGITPYDTTHLGHAAAFVWADMAARILRLTGHPVEVCRNITDVDDHLLLQAKVEGVPWKSLATQQSYRFEHDMDLLGIAHPAFEPRSHDHVDGVIALAAELLARGLAYERNGSVYFRGGAVHETAGLSRGEATSLATERGGHPDDPNKDDALDAALWVRSIGDEPAWPSPWAPGRPGWHAECTAMALTTFGATVDLHAGGADLAFPHHAYEAAQAEAFTGVHPFARSWMHVGTVMAVARRWPSPPATWCSSMTCSNAGLRPHSDTSSCRGHGTNPGSLTSPSSTEQKTNSRTFGSSRRSPVDRRRRCRRCVGLCSRTWTSNGP
jgi:cysteinyl-tRNA synthetase